MLLCQLQCVFQEVVVKGLEKGLSFHEGSCWNHHSLLMVHFRDGLQQSAVKGVTGVEELNTLQLERVCSVELQEKLQSIQSYNSPMDTLLTIINRY